MNLQKKIILASASPRRKELLNQIGISFEICPSTCDEAVEFSTPEKMVQDLSRMKAEDVWEKVEAERKNDCDRKQVLIIGADTIVVSGGEEEAEEECGFEDRDRKRHQSLFDLISQKLPSGDREDENCPGKSKTTRKSEIEVLGKPKDEADALRMLSSLQGRKHRVFTGVTFIFVDENDQKRTHSFYEKTDVFLYPMTQEEILSYIRSGDPMDKAGAYGIQGPFAAYVRGIIGDYNNVVGLPVGRVFQELKEVL